MIHPTYSSLYTVVMMTPSATRRLWYRQRRQRIRILAAPLSVIEIEPWVYFTLRIKLGHCPAAAFQVECCLFFAHETMGPSTPMVCHLLFCLGICFTSSLTSPLLSRRDAAYLSASNSSLRLSQSSTSASSRNVSIILDLNYVSPKLSSNGTRMLGGHLALHIAGTDKDGPLQIEIVRSTALALRVYDWNPSNSHQPIPVNGSEGCKRTIYPAGHTNLTNPIFADPTTGLGLVSLLTQRRPGYVSGWNSGLHLVRDLAMVVGQLDDARFFHVFDLIEKYERQPPLLAQKSLPLLLERVGTWGDNTTNTLLQFRTDTPRNSTSSAEDASLNDTGDPFAGAAFNATTGKTPNGNFSLSASAQLNGSAPLDGSSDYNWILQLLDQVANAPSNGTNQTVVSSPPSYGAPILSTAQFYPDSGDLPNDSPGGWLPLTEPWHQATPLQAPSLVRRQPPPPNTSPLDLWEGPHRMAETWGPYVDYLNNEFVRRAELAEVGRTSHSIPERQALLRQVQALPTELADGLMQSIRELPRLPQEAILRQVGRMAPAPQAALLRLIARLPPPARFQVLNRLRYMCAEPRRIVLYELVNTEPPAHPPTLRTGVGVDPRQPLQIPQLEPPFSLEPDSHSEFVNSFREAADRGDVDAADDLNLPRSPPPDWWWPDWDNAVDPTLLPAPHDPPRAPQEGTGSRSESGSESAERGGGSTSAERGGESTRGQHGSESGEDGGQHGEDGTPGNCGRSLDRRAACKPGGSAPEESKPLLPTEEQVSLAYQSDPEPLKSVSVFRINGGFSVFELTIGAAGVAATLVSVALVFVDFVNGNYVGGAVGLASLAEGIGLAALASWPVGWVLGALTALFTVLAHFASGMDEKDLAQRDNATQIIRYAFFGKDVSGNENCQAGRHGQQGLPDVPGNPDCQVVYAPGMLKTALQWDNVDTAVFLLHFNDGYPMTIPGIADAFYTLKGDDGDANRVATIKCGDYTPPCAVIDNNCPATDNTVCNDPVFGLNKDLITISPWNMTASQLRDKIGTGDCKLNSGVSTYYYADYPIKVTGNPAAISCDVMSGNASTSTDSNSHYVNAPAAQGFAPTINSSSAVCLLGADGKQLCLPSGVYMPQTGATGPLDTTDTLGISIPQAGWFKTQGQTFTANVTVDGADPSDGDFRAQMALAGPFENHASDAIEPAAACLFADKDFQGDVACFGVGGGDVPDSIRNKARSLSLHAGATAWLFADHYNDAGAAQVTDSTANLEQIAYGLAQSFAGRIKALWVVRWEEGEGRFDKGWSRNISR